MDYLNKTRDNFAYTPRRFFYLKLGIYSIALKFHFLHAEYHAEQFCTEIFKLNPGNCRKLLQMPDSTFEFSVKKSSVIYFFYPHTSLSKGYMAYVS